jgi:hypothetical protein
MLRIHRQITSGRPEEELQALAKCHPSLCPSVQQPWLTPSGAFSADDLADQLG